MSYSYRYPQFVVKGFDDGARWFAGKGRQITDLVATDAAGGLRFADVAYADGGRERYLLVDEALSFAALLDRLLTGPLAGRGGTLTLRRGAALEGLLTGPTASEHVPSTDQSNTLVVVGDCLLVKAYRRLEAGVHPEVELLTALAGTPAPVPPFAGSLHWCDSDGSDTAVALLQGFVAGAETGWEPAILRTAAALVAGPPFDVAEWQQAGAVAARLHAALASAFPPRQARAAELAGCERDARSALEVAIGFEPGLRQHAPRLARRLEAIGAATGLQVTRVHGDLHVAQLLRSADGVRVIDFEGDPTRGLDERRRPDTSLRDVAGLLRCIDHVASAAARRVDGRLAEAWIDAARTAALDGYGDLGAPDATGHLLAALEIAKECAELAYAHRVLPEWRYAPWIGLHRLLEQA